MGPKTHNRKKQGERKRILSQQEILFQMTNNVNRRVNIQGETLDIMLTTQQTFVHDLTLLKAETDALCAKVDNQYKLMEKQRDRARRHAREANHAVDMWRRMAYAILVVCSIVLLLVIVNQAKAEAKDVEEGPQTITVEIVESAEVPEWETT